MIQVQQQDNNTGRWKTIKIFEQEITIIKRKFLFFNYNSCTFNQTVQEIAIEAVKFAKTLNGCVRVKHDLGDEYLIFWKNGFWLHSIDRLI